MLLTNGPSRLLGGGRVPWYRAGGAPLPVAAYQPKGAASLAASYVNLARTDGTYNAAPGVAPGWSAAAGWTFNGSTQWLNTGVVPVAQTWSVLIRFSNVTNSGMLFGVTVNASARWAIYRNGATSIQYFQTTAGVASVAPAMTAGVLGYAGRVGYRNGAADTGTLAAWTVGMDRAVFVGADNFQGAPSFFTACNIQALAIYSATLTAAQLAAVSAAMAAL